MIAEFLIGFFISLLVALIMIGIGISQLKSKTPAAFYEAAEKVDITAYIWYNVIIQYRR